MKKKRCIAGVFLLFLAPCLGAQQTLTLTECRKQAIQNNKELQIGNEKVRAAVNEQKAAATKYFPQVSATGAYLWNQKDFNLVDFGKFGPAGELIPGEIKDFFHLDIQNVFVGNVSLVQPVFMGGKIIAYNQIMQYAKELAKSMHDTQLQDIIYKTDETYWQVVSLVNKKKLADAYVDLLCKMDSDVQLLIQEGLATKAEGLSVKVKLNEAEMAQTKVNNGLSLTRMLLAKLCGLPLTEEFALADESIDHLSVSSHATRTADVNIAFMNRSELRSLDYATKIFRKKETIVLSEMLPSVAFTANYLVMNPNLYNGFKNKFDGMFSVGVALQIPISGWAEGTFKRNAARAETRIKRLEYQNARDMIRLEVNQSIYKNNEAEKKLIASRRNMQNAEENLRHANIGFEEGVIPALHLMEAQTAWVSAHSDLIDAQIEVKLTEAYLSKAMGDMNSPEQK